MPDVHTECWMHRRAQIAKSYVLREISLSITKRAIFARELAGAGRAGVPIYEVT